VTKENIVESNTRPTQGGATARQLLRLKAEGCAWGGRSHLARVRHAQGVHGIGGDGTAADRGRGSTASTLLTSNGPVEDCGKLLGGVAAVTALRDRILHHRHVLKSGPRSWRTRAAANTAGGTP